MGLLLPHKRTLKVYPDMITVSTQGGGSVNGGGKRGTISVFSAESRYRLFRLLHQLTFERITFCTLTYPDEFPVDKKIYKAHLKEYRRRFERLYGAVRGVWRLEFQKRGAPHYHIMYLDMPYVPVDAWCNLWSNVIGTDDENHRRIGVDVKLVTGGSEKGLIASYLGKYVGKVDDRPAAEVIERPGRWWGKWNIEEDLPVEVDLYDYEAAAVVGEVLDARKKKDWMPLDFTVCTIFGEHMGSEDFRHMVLQRVGAITDKTRAGGKKKARGRKKNGL